jgi:hypothetical protein
MKNKFEALNAFQSWPENWQRLCAEYWAENDKPKGVTVWTNSDKLATAAKSMHIEPDAVAKIAEGVKKSIIPWTTIEEEYLAKCWEDSNRNRTSAARLFLEKHPGRSLNAVCRHIWDMKAADGHLVIRY